MAYGTVPEKDSPVNQTANHYAHDNEETEIDLKELFLSFLDHIGSNLNDQGLRRTSCPSIEQPEHLQLGAVGHNVGRVQEYRAVGRALTAVTR